MTIIEQSYMHTVPNALRSISDTLNTICHRETGNPIIEFNTDDNHTRIEQFESLDYDADTRRYKINGYGVTETEYERIAGIIRTLQSFCP